MYSSYSRPCAVWPTAYRWLLPVFALILAIGSLPACLPLGLPATAQASSPNMPSDPSWSNFAGIDDLPKIAAADATTWYVAAMTGNDANDCLTPATACQTIGAAIGKAADGDTILIAAGIYDEFFSIDKDLTIIGAGASNTIVDGTIGLDASVVGVPQDANVALIGMTLQGGEATPGGGIATAGTLLLDDVTVRNNHGGSNGGGGIYNYGGGRLTIRNSTITGNRAEPNRGGGLYNAADGTVIITNSTISGNTATGDSGGIYNAGTMTLIGSTVHDNTAASGGGIVNGGMLTLTDSHVDGNTTSTENNTSAGGGIFNGGTLVVNGGTISGNTATGNGGGIVNEATGTVTLNAATIGGNSAMFYGGGVLNLGTLTLNQSTIRENSLTANEPSSGGGIMNGNDGHLTLEASAVISNTVIGTPTSDGGGSGGGISSSGTITLINSTVSGNQAPRGAGIYTTGMFTATNSTISANEASNQVGGIYGRTGGGDQISLANTIIGGNIDQGEFQLPDCSGVFHSQGYNLLGNQGNTLYCTFQPTSGDQVGTLENPLDPKLAPLADNGGPTLTHALLPDSPAIDAGDDASCLETDQRGTRRPQRNACDIGAYELSGIIWYVAPTGNDANNCLTPATACKTIGAAIGKAAGGETINIAAGIYDEPVLIRKSLALVGAGTEGDASTATIVNGHQPSVPDASVVGVVPGATASISGMRLQGGKATPGGGIANQGNLTVSDSVIADNVGGSNGGGGIYNYAPGILTIRNSTISGNLASPNNGGGIYNAVGATVTISESTIINNQADNVGGGIYNLGRMTIDRSTISGNTARSSAGVYNRGTSATMRIVNSTISGNRAEQAGAIGNSGELTIINSMISGNSTVDGNVADKSGGGIRNGGTLTLTDTTISGNSARTRGGGIYSEGTVTLDGSTISGNSAGFGGGGIFNAQSGRVIIQDSAITSNSAGFSGGGIFNNYGKSWIGNSTISGNSATNNGGGIRYNSVVTSTLVITSTTISNNTAGDGGGIVVTNATAPPTLQSTILAGNHAGTSTDCSGPLVSLGYNLFGDRDGCAFTAAATDQTGSHTSLLDPQLAPLPDNGDLTPTHALMPGSPALDKVPPAACPPTDQRGVARPWGIGCDIGAYEATFDIRDSGLNLATETWHFQNPSGQINYNDYHAVFGEPTITRIITSTETGPITATDRLNLPFDLRSRDISAALPLSLTLPISGTGIAIPNLNAQMYETVVVSTTYADANVQFAGSALKSGLCVGMTSSVANFQAGGIDPAAYGVSSVSDLHIENPLVRSLIQQYHMRQLSAESLHYLANDGRHDNAKQYLDDLAARIGTSEWLKHPEIIGIVNHEGEPTQSCADAKVGHALLPYRVVRQDNPPLYRIYVYDPNYPADPLSNAEDHYIDVAQASDGSWKWRYAIAPNRPELTWEGRTLYSLPLSTLLVTPTLPTEDDQGVLLVNGGQDSAWGGQRGAWGGQRGAWGELNNGQVIGCVTGPGGNGLFFTQTISRSFRLFTLNGPALYVPTAAIRQSGGITFKSRGGTVSDMTVFGKHSVIGYLGTADGQTEDRLTVDPSLQTAALRTTDARTSKQITIYQMHEGEPGPDGISETHVVAASNVDLVASETLSMTVEEDAQGNVTEFTLVNSSNAAKTADLGFASVGGSGISTIVYRGQPIAPGEQRTYIPHDWKHLSSTPITVIIKKDGHQHTEVLNPFPSPVTRVLDSFTQPDGPLGANWSGRTEQDDYRISGQRVRVRDGGTLYWQANRFGDAQEAYVTLKRLDRHDSRIGLLLKVQGDAPNVRNGAIEVRYYAGDRRVRIRSRAPDQPWRVVATLPATFVNGDQLGARALADGTVQVYRNGAFVGEARAGHFFAHRGGHIGLRYLDADGATFDDFGGGTIQ